MPNWTKEQQQAIEFRNQSLLVAAAAGSGKTAVLVERICSMITAERPIDIDQLLVVTFTRAAASEMRERISARIALALEENPQDEDLVRQMALLNQASIMTIDSFCKKVIEDNFHLVDLDPDYQVMDENELNMLITETMTEVLEKAYEDADPIFLKLADTFGGDRDDLGLEQLVEKIWRFSRSGTDPEGWIRRSSALYEFDPDNFKQSDWYRHLLQEVRETAEEALRLSSKALDLIAQDPVLSANGKYAAFYREENEQLAKAVRGAEVTDDYALISSAMESVSFARRPMVKAQSRYKDWVADLRDQYKDLIQKLRRNLLSQDEAAFTRLIAEMAEPMRALGDLTLTFARELHKKKLENNRVDFADLEHFALGILRDENGPTETARSYQERFKEVLIDEYQDSNDVQEAILTAVSRNEQNIFMVGDVKQSIYRFRQAKPDIFLGKYRRFLGVEATEDCDGRKILLYKNFRSRPEVLDSVNTVFSAIMSERAGELDYTQEEALILGADYAPSANPVKICLIDSTSPLDTPQEDTGDLDDLKGIELEAKYVASKIKRLVTDGEMKILDRGVERSLRYRDIVILLRSTATASGLFKEALEEEAVPAFSDTGSGYFESIEIRTIMSILRCVDNPRQDIPLLAALRSPLFSFTEDELILLRAVDKNVLYLECLTRAANEKNLVEPYLTEKTRRFLSQLNTWREESVHTPLDEFIWKIYSDTAYMEYAGAMPNGLQRQANLRILFQRAGEYEKTAFKGLYRFIRYIDAMRERSGDYGDARIMGENEDVVRIMSIHKSKGLEFPVVFLANCGKNFNRRDQNGDLILHERLGMAIKHRDPERGTVEDTLPRLLLKNRINEEGISEEMRVLYVAMTRAKEHLYLTGSVRNLTGNAKNPTGAIGKWFRQGSYMGEERLSHRKVLADASYLDWIMPVVLSPRTAGPAEILEDALKGLKEKNAFDISLITRADLLEAVEKPSEEAKEAFWSGEDLTDEGLLKILDYRYPHEAATRLPSKVSVSVIKKRAIEEMEEAPSAAILDETYEDAPLLPKPEFLKQTRQLTGAERGTAFHTVMLHIDPRVGDLGEVDRQIRLMVDKELLLPEEAEAVSRHKVLGFFRSDLGRRFAKAAQSGKLYKEEAFIRSVPAKDLRPEWDADDPMTLAGIIDAFFEEDGEIILLDYKTDAVPAEAEVFLANRYSAQIHLYADALTSITGKAVREAYLYSVSREETVRLM